MRSRLFLLLFSSLFLTGRPLVGQDLGKLKQRVTKLWQLRQQPNKRIEGLAFVEPQSKELFLHRDEPVIVDFKIAAYKPTNEDNHLDVVLDTHISTSQGTFERTVTETWLWTKGDWYLKVDPLPPIVGGDKTKQAESARPPEFHLIADEVDAGQHAQGEVVTGRMAFRGNRNEIRLVRPVQAIEGLAISSPVWTSPSEGYIPYSWETVMLSQNVRQNIELEITGINDAKAKAAIGFSIRIDGRVRFRQTPEIVDPTKAGEFKLEIENLSSKPLRIHSMTSNNPLYTIVDDAPGDVPGTLAPGESGSLRIRYMAQPEPVGASLDLVLSEPLTASPVTRVPLHVLLPKPAPGPLITEEMRRLAEQESQKARQGAPQR
jgi:hypothetical protein